MAFQGYLKEDVATTLRLGPFVDATDGFTYEVGMAAAMNHATTGVRISKNGGALAARTTATEPVYDAFGYYLVNLDATDTETPGRLKVIFGDAAVCLPCEADFQVVAANVFDSLFSTAAADLLDVNMAQYLGTAAHAATEAGTPCVEVVRWGGSDIVATSVAGVPKVAVTHVNAAAQTATLDTIKADTVEVLTRVPDATAGAANGLTICGSNAATTFATLTSTGAVTTGSIVNNGVTTLTGALTTGAATLASASVTGQLDAGNVLVDTTTVLTGATTLASLSVTGQADAGNVLVDTTTVLTGAVTAPAGVTANITGTIDNVTTVGTATNLTNAPTSGDLTATMKTSVQTAMLSAGGSAGTARPYTLTDAGTAAAIVGAMVWVSTDIEGTTIIASGITNASGIVTFTLAAGTYYIWRSKAGYNFTNPDLEILV